MEVNLWIARLLRIVGLQ